MLKSMTGFGRERVMLDTKEIIVEIKSVNSRYYEFSAKYPRAYGYIEDKLKSLLAGKISRGKVEVSVSVFNRVGTDAEIEINEALAKQYVDALRGAGDTLSLADDLTLTSIMRLNDIFTIKKTVEDEEEVWSQIKAVAEAALDKFIQMRTTEGGKMYDDISSRLNFIEKQVGEVERLSPETTKAYMQRLTERIREIVEDRNIDDARVLTEAAIFSEKTAVDEETVRLRSHIAQYRQLLQSSEPVGRKLDFLTQELNREVNTIGSKCQDLEITKIVVDLKSEIEKIREQIQNVE